MYLAALQCGYGSGTSHEPSDTDTTLYNFLQVFSTHQSSLPTVHSSYKIDILFLPSFSSVQSSYFILPVFDGYTSRQRTMFLREAIVSRLNVVDTKKQRVNCTSNDHFPCSIYFARGCTKI